MTGMLMSKSTRPGNSQSKGASVCHDAQLLTRRQAVRCQAGCEGPASSPAVQCRPASAGTSGLNMLLVFLRKAAGLAARGAVAGVAVSWTPVEGSCGISAGAGVMTCRCSTSSMAALCNHAKHLP